MSGCHRDALGRTRLKVLCCALQLNRLSLGENSHSAAAALVLRSSSEDCENLQYRLDKPQQINHGTRCSTGFSRSGAVKWSLVLIGRCFVPAHRVFLFIPGAGSTAEKRKRGPSVIKRIPNLFYSCHKYYVATGSASVAWLRLTQIGHGGARKYHSAWRVCLLRRVHCWRWFGSMIVWIAWSESALAWAK